MVEHFCIIKEENYLPKQISENITSEVIIFSDPLAFDGIISQVIALETKSILPILNAAPNLLEH